MKVLKFFVNIFSLSILLRLAHIKPPRTVPRAIAGATDKSKMPKPVVNAVVVSFENGENRIITREHTAAVFVSKENKYIIRAKLMRSPPIPSKDEQKARVIPTVRLTKIPLKFLILMRCLFFYINNDRQSKKRKNIFLKKLLFYRHWSINDKSKCLSEFSHF